MIIEDDPKEYIKPIRIDGNKCLKVDISIWDDSEIKLNFCTPRLRNRVLLTYFMYKGGARRELMPSKSTVWRHKKILSKAGFI